MLRCARRVGGAFLLLSVLGMSLACKRESKTPTSAVSPVTIEAALGNKLVKAGAPASLVARLDVSTERRTSNRRPPVNVALLVDTSGSMEGGAIEHARAAALAFLDSLAPEDTLSVVAFNSRAELLRAASRIEDSDMKDLRRKIAAMKAEGTTDMGEGLRLAMNEVVRSFVPAGVNRIVMLGDGVPNDEQPIHSLVAEASSRGISVTTLGLGDDYDEVLMGRIAQRTGGKFSLVEDSSSIASFFREEVVRLHHVVAKSAYVDLRPGPGVVVSNVVGRPMTQRERGVRVFLGDLSLGERHELIVELSSTAAKPGAALEVMDVEVHWSEAVGGAPHEERAFLGARSTADEGQVAAGVDPSVADAAARAKDAAATLKKIEQESRTLRSKDGAPGEGERAPAMPVNDDTSAALDEPTKPARPTPLELRRIHRDAIRNFQAH